MSAPQGARRLLLATHSAHKASELRALLDLPAVTLLTPAEVGIRDEPAEDARTFHGNAARKARFYAERSGLPTLADDSGIEVEALGGGPGVLTRRFAGPAATDADNNAKLLRALRGRSPGERGARYRCVLAFADPSADPAAAAAAGAALVFRSGTFRGRIATSARGDGGFGYDPIFEPWTEPPGGRTVAQLSAAEKGRLSHRGRAARAMARYLRSAGW